MNEGAADINCKKKTKHLEAFHTSESVCRYFLLNVVPKVCVTPLSPFPKPETVISIKELSLNFDANDVHEFESRTRPGIKHVTMKNEQIVLIISTNLYRNAEAVAAVSM